MFTAGQVCKRGLLTLSTASSNPSLQSISPNTKSTSAPGGSEATAAEKLYFG